MSRYLVLVPVLLLAASVRILGIGNTDLWGDEAFSVMASLGPVRNLLSMLASGEPHPPLYPFLLVVWLRALGHSEVVARLPSAFAGIASVAVAMALARSFVAKGDERAATIASIVAGLLVALNPIQVWYSQEARMYAQVSFFAGLATLALSRLWRGRRWSTTLYVVAVLGAAGSHYYGLFVPVAHGFAVLAFAGRRRDVFWRWLRASVVAAVLYLPWVAVASRVFTRYYGARPGTVDLPGIALSGWVRMAAGWSLSWPHAVAVAGVVTALVAIGLAVKPSSEDDRFARVVLASWLLTPFVVGFAVSILRPLYAERYFVVSSLPFGLLMARGIVAIWPASAMAGRRLRTAMIATRGIACALAIVAAIAVALLPLYNVWIGRYLKSAYDSHMRMVTAMALPGDAVILDGTSQLPLYQYYLQKPFPTYPLPDLLPLDPSRTTDQLATIAKTHSGAWIFLYATPDYDPGYFIPRWLTTHAYRSYDVWEVNGRLQYYRFAPAALSATRATRIRFGDSLSLERYAWQDEGYAAGESVPLDLGWRWLATPVSQPRVALRLVDDVGFTWAQSEDSIGGGYLPDGSWPTGQSTNDLHGLMVPLGTPPGTYHLLMTVYSPEQPRGLIPTGEGAEIGPGGVRLADVRVTRASQSVWADGIAGFHPTTATYGGSLALLGYAGSDSIKAGESGYLTVIWKASAPHPNVSRVRIELIGADGKVAESRDLLLATPAYPPSAWQAGDVLREQYRLPTSARLPPGNYRLTVRPLLDGASATALGPLAIAPGAASAPESPPQHALDSTLGNAVALEGYDLDTEPGSAGETLHLTLHWKDVAPLDNDFTVFVHVLDASQKVVAQRDQPPAAGKRPTSAWFPGDVIVDRYTLALPANLPPGDYPIEVGMYNPSDGKRLSVSREGKADGDRIIVTALHRG